MARDYWFQDWRYSSVAGHVNTWLWRELAWCLSLNFYQLHPKSKRRQHSKLVDWDLIKAGKTLNARDLSEVIKVSGAILR